MHPACMSTVTTLFLVTNSILALICNCLLTVVLAVTILCIFLASCNDSVRTRLTSRYFGCGFGRPSQFILSALHLIEISVPRFKQISGVATLRCMYDLGPSAALYSIKWYKNEAEFYRYLPGDSPPGQAFSLPGIVVDLHDSDEYQVSLTSLTLSSSGTFKCEVSTEAPIFHTISGESPMTIIALPVESPRISGLLGLYNEGDEISLNCTSPHSKPVTKLSWYINGKRADPSSLIYYGTETDPYSDMDQSTVGIKLLATSRLFHGRVLSVRCVASLAHRTWQHQRWSILYQTPTSVASSIHRQHIILCAFFVVAVQIANVMTWFYFLVVIV